MILITGATGLVGSYIARYLVQSGEKVRALRRPTSELSLLGAAADQIEWVEADLTDILSLEKALEGVDKIYHTATVISFEKKDQDRMMKVNGEGTANLVNVALSLGAKKLLYVSSVVALGKGKPNMILDESEENLDADYETTYGLSKSLAELEVWRGMMEGLDAVVINPSIILGGGYWDSYGPRLFSSISKGFPFQLPGSTGFVDVRDVAKAAIQLMDSPLKNERFIVSADNLTYSAVLDMIAASLKVKAPSITSAKSTSGITAAAESVLAVIQGRKTLFNSQNVKHVHSHFKYSNEKIKKALNFKFTPVAETITDTSALLQQSISEGKNFGVLAL